MREITLAEARRMHLEAISALSEKAKDYDRLEAENKALRADIERYVSEGIKLADQRDALRSRVVVVPRRKGRDDLIKDTHFSQGWNACLDRLSRLNGKTVSEGLLERIAKPGNWGGDVSFWNAIEELRALFDAWNGDGNGQ